MCCFYVLYLPDCLPILNTSYLFGEFSPTEKAKADKNGADRCSKNGHAVTVAFAPFANQSSRSKDASSLA